MEKEELREKYSAFLKSRELDTQISNFAIYEKYFFDVISKHHSRPHKTQALAEATMIHQMMFTKLLSLKKLVEGISYHEKGEQKLNNIIDPTTILSLVRNVYETAFTFSLIYRKAEKGEQRDIAYSLWAIAGLKYRQKFSAISTLEESKRKIVIEKKAIDNLTEFITETDLYKKSGKKSQALIDRMIKKKNFKLIFEDNSIKQLFWGDSKKAFDLNNDLMDETYTYFSLFTHPSNVSVFQFSDMFNKETEDFKGIINTNLKNLFTLYSFFISDYISLFPDTLEVFEEQPKFNQIIIDHFNLWMRDEEFTINNATQRYLE